MRGRGGWAGEGLIGQPNDRGAGGWGEWAGEGVGAAAARCVIGDKCGDSAADLFAAYREWAESAHLSPRDTLAKNKFGSVMREHFTDRRGTAGVCLYDGVRLKTDEERQEEERLRAVTK